MSIEYLVTLYSGKKRIGSADFWNTSLQTLPPGSGTADDGFWFAGGQGKIIAVPMGSATRNWYYISYDYGVSWVLGTFPLTRQPYSVTYGNGQFFVLLRGTSASVPALLLVSSDGGTWTTRDTAVYSSRYWSNCSFVNGMLCLWYQGGTRFARSLDSGFTWTVHVYPTGWARQVAGDGNSTIVVAGQTNSAFSTDNGTTWSSVAFDTSTTSVAYGGGLFCTPSTTTTARYSPNGVNWYASAPMPFAATWNSVIYAENQFIFVGSVASAKVSCHTQDFATWRVAPMLGGTYRQLGTVDGYVVAGKDTDNTILRSRYPSSVVFP